MVSYYVRVQVWGDGEQERGDIIRASESNFSEVEDMIGVARQFRSRLETEEIRITTSLVIIIIIARIYRVPDTILRSCSGSFRRLNSFHPHSDSMR